MKKLVSCKANSPFPHPSGQPIRHGKDPKVQHTFFLVTTAMGIYNLGPAKFVADSANEPTSNSQSILSPWSGE